MGKFMLFFFWPSLKANYWEQLWKDFFEDVDDKTPTSMEINGFHKSESTTITSHLWDWPTGYSLPCIKKKRLFLWSIYRCRQRKGLFNILGRTWCPKSLLTSASLENIADDLLKIAW